MEREEWRGLILLVQQGEQRIERTAYEFGALIAAERDASASAGSSSRVSGMAAVVGAVRCISIQPETRLSPSPDRLFRWLMIC